MTLSDVDRHLVTTEHGTQTVEVRRIDVEGAAGIEVLSVIGPLRHVSQMELLSQNLRSAIGAFCLHDGLLAMRQTLPLLGLRPIDLDLTIRAIGHQSASARAHIGNQI